MFWAKNGITIAAIPSNLQLFPPWSVHAPAFTSLFACSMLPDVL